MPVHTTTPRPPRYTPKVLHVPGMVRQAQVSTAMVVDKSSANDPAMAALINNADLVYLSGGSPWVLAEILRESLVMVAIEMQSVMLYCLSSRRP